MFLPIEKGHNAHSVNNISIKNFYKNKTFQRAFIGFVTFVAAYFIVLSGAAPKKYDLKLGDESQYDINAPHEIINTVITELNEKRAENDAPPEMMEIVNASIEVLNDADDFFTIIETTRKNITKNLYEQGVGKRDSNYKEVLALEKELASRTAESQVAKLGIVLSGEQIRYLVGKLTDDELQMFERTTKGLVTSVMKDDITKDTLPSKIIKLQNDFQSQDLNQEIKNIGGIVAKCILKPNRTVNQKATEAKKEIARKDPNNIETIRKGQRIISKGDKVTKDKLKVLEDLNLLETKQKFDYGLTISILVLLLFLAILLILFMNYFCKKILYNRNDLILLSVVIMITLASARWVYEYSPLAIPIFIATMLISILLDLRLAWFVNIILVLAVSFMVKDDLKFVYMSLISGNFAAFLVSKANQRSKLSMGGAVIAVLNVIIVICLGLLNKSDFDTIYFESKVAFANGLISTILTIGILPFLESIFNIITPIKLLELTNPNQPLVKRLLMEAPGTYHHSLMVGNLAEAGTEAVGGNALLARVGAYFHDIGKLKRPNFFIENQFSDNPHDRMTANLSTLVITSHTQDGLELAKRYKIPMAIQDIIIQHHGTTLVAYFYHKAKKSDKGDIVKPENFRYSGPKPCTREAAVVMLADCVEAAVRSMVDKTEGKIEGLVRKIIKDKLDDGQLDMCSLTLKDLDNIAKAFMRVFSGFFHGREEYPDVKAKSPEPSSTDKTQTSDNTKEVDS